MSSVGLKVPILDDGIRSIHFFNGRLLAAEDLSQEQVANRAAHQRLGRAAGDGIVTGLQVSKTLGASDPRAPVVTVKAGLAVNRMGQVLTLASDVDVALSTTSSGSTATVTRIFADCRPLQAGPYVSDSGIYMLCISPVEVTEGRAPFSGLGDVPSSCDTDHTVEGVQFRLIQISLTPAELDDTQHLRSLIAGKCFGLADTRYTSFVSNPFGSPVERYGLLDNMRGKCLKDVDVPLAILSWTTTGLQFIDLWSVRRRLTHPAVSEDWPLLVYDRRQAEAEAILAQFQDQLVDLRDSASSPASLAARDYFDYLPPVGLLPLTGQGALRGFVPGTFFAGHASRGPFYVEGAMLEPLIRESLTYAPIDAQGGELIWLYAVHENRDPQVYGASAPPPYLVFTSGYVPFRGATRFSAAHYNYANYTLLTALTEQSGRGG